MDILEFVKTLPEDECGNRKRILDFLNGNYKPRYYLRVNGKYLETDVSVNGPDADCCGETTTSLHEGSKRVCAETWWTDNLWHAITVKYVPTPWYNSTYENPQHYKKPHEIEVVREDGKIYNFKPLSEWHWALMKDVIAGYNVIENKVHNHTYYKDHVEKWYDKDPKEVCIRPWSEMKYIIEEYKEVVKCLQSKK